MKKLSLRRKVQALLHQCLQINTMDVLHTVFQTDEGGQLGSR